MESDTCQALVSLIHWDSPLGGLIEAANQCDRIDGPPVFLNRPAVREVLRRCISGDLNILELQQWAGSVHMLERVEISEEDTELLTQFLFEVSTPEIFEPITASVCQRWVDRLR